MDDIIEMTEDIFKGIYTNPKLRHVVAYAHGCSVGGEIEYFKALMYPLSYKVTVEQIEEAKRVLEMEKQKILTENKNNLLFCGMGMEFKPEINDGIGNHRIRTHFINNDGKECFIELGTKCDKIVKKKRIKDNNLRIDFAILDYNKKDKYGYDSFSYNYKGLESNTPEMLYTYENVLKLVNEYFNCSFKKMVVDYYHIHCDSILCISKNKKEVKK